MNCSVRCDCVTTKNLDTAVLVLIVGFALLWLFSTVVIVFAVLQRNINNLRVATATSNVVKEESETAHSLL